MAKDKGATPLEDTAGQADAAATPVAPEPSQASGEASSAPGVVSEAEVAAEKTLAEVREELSRAEQVVMEWVGDHFSNSPVSRATEALNYLRQHAVPDLLNRLKEI